jgi:hypothetical protein
MDMEDDTDLETWYPGERADIVRAYNRRALIIGLTVILIITMLMAPSIIAALRGN